jgi:ATPase subunit of ABC transporter with duplicated ATPase domains
MTTLISEEKLSIKLGNKLIIDESKLVVNENVRYGIVGSNGCGKSTLIDYIMTKLPQNIKAYMVNQHIQFDSNDQTVLNFMLRADSKIYDINQKIIELELKEEMTDDELDTYTNLTESAEYSEYEKYISESKKILKGLGISNYEDKISNYSGGWRMRLAIAKSLISKPYVLIMDEPTNHLDLNAVIWLSNYLQTYTRTLIVVSHQIDFINSCTNVIWYIGTPDFTTPKLYSVNGSYIKLQQTLNDISKTAISAWKKFENGLEAIKKQKQKKKEKQNKQQNSSKTDIEAYIKKNSVPRPSKPYEVIIKFPDVTFSNNDRHIIRFEDVSFFYNSTIDKKPILSNTEFSIGLKSRYVIVGENGVGKTTIFKLCSGELIPTDGYIIKDERVKIAYYNQQVIESLPLELTPIEYLQLLNSALDIAMCRAYLGKIGLRKQTDIDNGDPCNIPIKKLSGGQKARVSFCSIQVKEPNIILLDEPTNHLDIESIQGLIQGINEYNGGIVMITHDIYVISQINDIKIYEVKDQKIQIFKGEIEEYVDKVIEDINN